MFQDTVNSIMNYNTKDIGPIVIYVVGSQARKYREFVNRSLV